MSSTVTLNPLYHKAYESTECLDSFQGRQILGARFPPRKMTAEMRMGLQTSRHKEGRYLWGRNWLFGHCGVKENQGLLAQLPKTDGMRENVCLVFPASFAEDDLWAEYTKQKQPQ